MTSSRTRSQWQLSNRRLVAENAELRARVKRLEAAARALLAVPLSVAVTPGNAKPLVRADAAITELRRVLADRFPAPTEET